MTGEIRIAFGSLATGIGATILFGAPAFPIPVDANLPLIGMVTTAVGGAVLISGAERAYADYRLRNGVGDVGRLHRRLVKLIEQERMAEHRLWLAEQKGKRGELSGSDARKLVLRRDTALTKIRARIATTSALIQLAEGSPSEP